ncbi:hypothetical protein BV25DRAFT_1839038 [Artomyces pyxidatus]|uniref:Uncharacterized protein n=1 Tax=Artomyces pyxidatus TaxID=48021 RepID=A0ACB8SZG9_9AGAM|nr:hypothetical protein BV25DRAFT_1839038 [Artomyces pyxidatus]
MLSLSHALRTLHDAHAECLTQSRTVHDGAPMDAILRYIRRVETHASAFKDPGGEGGGLSNYPSVVTEHHLRLLRGDHELLSRDPPSELRQGLVAEAGALLTVLLAVMAEYNVLSPISRLPPELVALIIEECAAARLCEEDVAPRGYPCGHLRSVGRADATWRREAQFCRVWNDTYSTIPHPWRRISLATGLPFAATSADRAKSMPLDLDVPIYRAEDARSKLDFVSYHLHRTRRLVVVAYIDASQFPGLLTVAFPPVAPLLEVLELTLYGPWCFSEAPILQEAPLLHRLILRGSIIPPWGSSILTNLVSLEVSGTGSARQPPKTIADILATMHALEVLILSSVLEDVVDPAHPLPDFPEISLPVSLPSLKAITLFDRAPQILQFLWCVCPPEDADAAITCYTGYCPRTLSLIVAALPTRNRPQRISVSMTRGSATLWASSTSRTSVVLTHVAFHRGSNGQEPWEPLSLLDAAGGAFRISELDTLSLCSSGESDASDGAGAAWGRWHASLEPARALTCLEIDYKRASSLLAALETAPSPTASGGVFLPGLKTLLVVTGDVRMAPRLENRLRAAMAARGGVLEL